jgi:hypothetical protein
MCQQCKQLSKKIGQYSQLECLPSDDQEMDLYILGIFEAASLFLETSTCEGDIRENLGRATDNLVKMYELDAPECLIRKAHSVQRKRLRNFRASMRPDLEARVVSPKQRRREFLLVRGGRR